MGFFYFVLVFTALLLPFYISVDGAFSFDRRLFFAVIKLYGIQLISVKIFFSKEGEILLSVNDKKGKAISKRSEDKEEKHSRNYLPLLNALIFTKIELTVYAGGEPERVSVFLAALSFMLEQALWSLPRRPDSCRIEALPCFVNDQTTAKFSIRFFSAAAPLLFAFAHTTKGEKNAKRSDRKFDG